MKATTKKLETGTGWKNNSSPKPRPVNVPSPYGPWSGAGNGREIAKKIKEAK